MALRYQRQILHELLHIVCPGEVIGGGERKHLEVVRQDAHVYRGQPLGGAPIGHLDIIGLDVQVDQGADVEDNQERNTCHPQ